MKISKIFTGVYNLLLIEVEFGIIDADLDKRNKILKIILNGEETSIDLRDYMDVYSKEIKVLGLYSLLRERYLRSLLPLDTIYRKDWNTNKYSKKFKEMLNEAEWDIDDRKTLIVRI
jgi:hypothetical protein